MAKVSVRVIHNFLSFTVLQC